MSFNQKVKKVISRKNQTLIFWTQNDLLLEFSLRFCRILKVYSIKMILQHFVKNPKKVKLKDVEFNKIRKEFLVSDSTGRLLMFNESKSAF